MPGPMRRQVRRARDAFRQTLRAVWSRDRRSFRRLARLRNRLGRLLIWTIWSLFRHRLSSRAAALTYYTVFSIVPVLAVALGVMRWLHLIGETPSGLPLGLSRAVEGNGALLRASSAILTAVAAKGGFNAGLIGLVTLAYGIFRLVTNMDRSLRAIVGADDRRAGIGWLLGHAVLLTIAPAMVTAASLLSVAAPWLLRKIEVAHFLVALPLVEVALAALLPLLAVWLVLALFYATAAPGRLPSRSAVFGGAAGALALAVLLGVFGWFQVGASRASVVDASVAAVPVFMLWVYSSWLVVLLGAELAVGHATDRLLPGGVRAWRLDAACTRRLAVLIAARAAREGAGARCGTEWITTELPQQTGLPPAAMFEVGRLLLRRGLVRQTDDGYLLAPQAEAMRPADVEEAVENDPALADVRRELDRAVGDELAELHELHELNVLDARRA